MLTSSVRAVAKASMTVNPMKKTRTSMKGMAMKAALKGMSTQSRKKTVTSMKGMGAMKVAKKAAKESVSPQKVTNALRAAIKAMKKAVGDEEGRIENWSWYDVRGLDHFWVVASKVGAKNKIEVQAYGRLDI